MFAQSPVSIQYESSSNVRILLRDIDGTNPVAFAKKYAASVEFSIQNREEPPVYKVNVGDSVFDLVVPESGPHGPVRPDEFSLVGVFDIDWLTDTRFERLLDNMMASPGALKRVRVFKCLNSGAQESGFGPAPVASSGIVWPNVAAPMNFSLTLNGLAEITSRGLACLPKRATISRTKIKPVQLSGSRRRPGRGAN